MKVYISAQIDKDLYDAIEEERKDLDISRSKTIAIALRESPRIAKRLKKP